MSECLKIGLFRRKIRGESEGRLVVHKQPGQNGSKRTLNGYEERSTDGNVVEIRGNTFVQAAVRRLNGWKIEILPVMNNYNGMDDL